MTKTAFVGFSEVNTLKDVIIKNISLHLSCPVWKFCCLILKRLHRMLCVSTTLFLMATIPKKLQTFAKFWVSKSSDEFLFIKCITLAQTFLCGCFCSNVKIKEMCLYN